LPVCQLLCNAVERFVRVEIEAVGLIKSLGKIIAAYKIRPAIEAQGSSGVLRHAAKIRIDFYSQGPCEKTGYAGDDAVSTAKVDEKIIDGKIDRSKKIKDMRCSGGRPGAQFGMAVESRS